MQYTETSHRVGRFVRTYHQPETVDAEEYIESEIGIQVEYVNSIEDVGRILDILPV